MKIKVLASTKVGYALPKEAAVDFSGKSARYTKMQPELYNYLLPYSKGARCTFPGWKCKSPCIFGGKNAMHRII